MWGGGTAVSSYFIEHKDNYGQVQQRVTLFHVAVVRDQLNFLFFYPCHKDLEKDWPVSRRLIDDGALLYFSLLHHYVPNTEESEHSSFKCLSFRLLLTRCLVDLLLYQ